MLVAGGCWGRVDVGCWGRDTCTVLSPSNQRLRTRLLLGARGVPDYLRVAPTPDANSPRQSHSQAIKSVHSDIFTVFVLVC